MPKAPDASRMFRRVAARETHSSLPSRQRELALLVWQDEHTRHYRCNGDILTRAARHTHAAEDPWAAGSILPMHGTYSFTIQVQDAREPTRCCIGLCDAKCTVAYGLHIGSGRLLLTTRAADGHTHDGAPAPVGWPEINGVRVNVSPPAPIAPLLIECIIDADAGTAAFRINGQAQREGLYGLPPHAALRPWVHLVYSGDRIRLQPGFGMLGLGRQPSGAARSQSAVRRSAHQVRGTSSAWPRAQQERPRLV